ncbi:MAG: acyl-CoA acyltransferase [Enterovirga sp.]|nr:acyl-CoA acyltransferase [Enterovirga sp.]
MSTIAAERPHELAAPAAGGDDVRIEMLPSLEAAEPAWRAFEAQAVASPYQRFDWVCAYAREAGAGEDIRVAVLRDRSDRTLAILPVAVTRRLGLHIGRGIGGKHANFNLPLMAAGLSDRVAPEGFRDVLRRLGRALRVDVLSLPDIPVCWGGEAVPLARFGQPSPSNAYQVALEADPDATALRSMTTEARKRLRNKERGLAKLGPVAFAQARTEAEAGRLLDAFFRQKEERFRELGIPDPFLDPSVRAFIRRGATEGLAEGRPAIELYGLTVGEVVAAVLGGAADAHRLSGMFISFEACPEATKYSPGDILVSRVVRDQCLRGRGFFDLGVGEARYKRTFCNEPVELVDVVLPLSAKGTVYGAALQAGVALKRRIKQNPRAMQLIARLRRAKAASTG